MLANLRSSQRRLGVVVLVPMMLAACGGSGGEADPSTAPSVVDRTSGGEGSEASIALEVVGEVTTTSSQPTTTVPPTTANGTTARTASTPAVDDAGVVDLPEQTPLVGGTRYVVPGKISTLTPSVSAEFIAPRDGVFGEAHNGSFWISVDEAGADSLLGITVLDRAMVIKTPFVDFQNLVITPELRQYLEEVPEDYLAWFSERPGVTAGPVAETEFGGHPARRMSYEVGAVPGAFPCAPPDPKTCLAWMSLTGIIIVGEEGDVGTLYEVDVAGTRVLVDVLDVDGATDLAESVELIAEAS